MNQILLVEDEPHLLASLSEFLSAEGLGVSCARSAGEAEPGPGKEIDCVVLDWMLPDRQGIELLRSWRARGVRTPVILLTARASLVDKVLGLEMGANDYLTKPFEPRELVARIRVQLRERNTGAVPEAPLQILSGNLRLDLRSREVTCDGQPVELKRLEFELLRLFLENPGQVFSRDELLNRVWGYDAYPTTRTVDNHILQLRKLFGNDRFETVRGIGYRYRETEK